MQASALPARLQRFSRSERALHWVIAATVIPMILSGVALGIDIWHHQVFVIHIGSLFALVAAVLVVVVFGNRPELGRLWRQLRRLTTATGPGSRRRPDRWSAARCRRPAGSTPARS